MWRNVVERGRPHMTIWRMRVTCWIRKTTSRHSEYKILIAFPLQQWLQKRASLLRDTYIANLVTVRVNQRCLGLLTFKAYWLRDAPTGLTFNNCTFCPHTVFVCFVFI